MFLKKAEIINFVKIKNQHQHFYKHFSSKNDFSYKNMHFFSQKTIANTHFIWNVLSKKSEASKLCYCPYIRPATKGCSPPGQLVYSIFSSSASF